MTSTAFGLRATPMATYCSCVRTCPNASVRIRCHMLREETKKTGRNHFMSDFRDWAQVTFKGRVEKVAKKTKKNSADSNNTHASCSSHPVQQVGRTTHRNNTLISHNSTQMTAQNI